MRKHLQKLKKKPNKSQNPSTSATSISNASTSDAAAPSDDGLLYQEVREWSILVTNVVRDVSEATSMLAPLKSTMALLTRGLEITRVDLSLSLSLYHAVSFISLYSC